MDATPILVPEPGPAEDAHTTGRKGARMPQVEVITRSGGRRVWTLASKASKLVTVTPVLTVAVASAFARRPIRVASDRTLRVSAIEFVSGPICAAWVLLATLLLGAPWAHAASSPASRDWSEGAAQARALLDTPQGATLLDLLGDPAVRERLMAAPTAPPPRAAMTGSMGFILDRVLGDTRQRIIDLGTQFRALPAELRACWDRV